MWNENDRTRTALGQAIHWYPAYNDGVKGEIARSMGIGFGEVNSNDNRARGGSASWGDPVFTENVRFAEKYVPPAAAGSNPTAWVEYNKGGVTSDQRDALLAQKEKGAVQASALMAPSVQAAMAKPGSFHVPAMDIGSKNRAYERLKRETAAVEREALPDGGVGRAPDWRPGAASDKADANWSIALGTVTGVRRWQEKAMLRQEFEAAEAERETALSALQEYAQSSAGTGSVLHTLTGLPRVREKPPKGWWPAPDPTFKDPAKEALRQAYFAPTTITSKRHVSALSPDGKSPSPQRPAEAPARRQDRPPSAPPQPSFSPQQQQQQPPPEAVAQRLARHGNPLYSPGAGAAKGAAPPPPPPKDPDKARQLSANYKIPSKARLSPTAHGLFQPPDDLAEKLDHSLQYERERAANLGKPPSGVKLHANPARIDPVRRSSACSSYSIH